MKQRSYLFGLPFLFAGIAVCYFFVFQPLQQAWQMQSWDPVPAQLISAQVTSYQSRNDNGGYTTMYKLQMQYRYQVGGVSYSGDRTSVSEISSSDSSEHYRRLGEVQRQQSSPAGLRVWVDPDQPSAAVYDREPDWTFLIMLGLFSGVFMLVGGGLTAYGVISSRSRVKPAAMDPQRPWSGRRQWQGPEIYSNARSSYRLYWFLSLLALMFIGMFAVPLLRVQPLIGYLLGACAVLVSGWLGRIAWRQQQAWHFYQKVPVILDPFPGVIGGHVAGSLILPGAPLASEQYSVTLECTHHWLERSGNETRSERAIVWEENQTPATAYVAEGTQLTFDFYVPASCEPTAEPGRNFHTWMLRVQAALPAMPFDRRYELPVYITDASQSVTAELEADPLSMEETAEMYDRLRVETVGEAINLQTPGSKSGWFIAAMGGAFFTIGALIALFGSAGFGATFATFSLIFVAAGVWIAGRQCHVRVTPERCEVDVFLFNRPVRQHRIAALSIVGVEAYRSSSTQVNGRRTDEKFSLRLYRDNGQTLDLGGEFATLRKAEHMRQEVLDILGLKFDD